MDYESGLFSPQGEQFTSKKVEALSNSILNTMRCLSLDIFDIF